MKSKRILSVAAALTLGAGYAFADEAKSFDTMAKLDAQPMAAEELAEVRGANHVIRLVLQQTGKAAMPTEAAAAATTRAGSIDGAGKDRPAIVKLLN